MLHATLFLTKSLFDMGDKWLALKNNIIIIIIK